MNKLLLALVLLLGLSAQAEVTAELTGFSGQSSNTKAAIQWAKLTFKDGIMTVMTCPKAHLVYKCTSVAVNPRKVGDQSAVDGNITYQLTDDLALSISGGLTVDRRTHYSLSVRYPNNETDYFELKPDAYISIK